MVVASARQLQVDRSSRFFCCDSSTGDRLGVSPPSSFTDADLGTRCDLSRQPRCLSLAGRIAESITPSVMSTMYSSRSARGTRAVPNTSNRKPATASPFPTPGHGMSGLKIKVGPVLLNPCGGVMHGMKASRRRFGRRAVGRQPSVSVRPRRWNSTRRVFVTALPLAIRFRQIQKHTVAIVEDEFLEPLQNPFSGFAEAGRVLQECKA